VEAQKTLPCQPITQNNVAAGRVGWKTPRSVVDDRRFFVISCVGGPDMELHASSPVVLCACASLSGDNNSNNPAGFDITSGRPYYAEVEYLLMAIVGCNGPGLA
jgi:hypothetical protein